MTDQLTRKVGDDKLDQVTGMRVFTRVAAVGSMAGAGRDMRISQTMVTKHIDAIEARLGVKLLHRTTRRLTLTEAGRAYLDACGRILAEIDEAEQEAIVGQSEPRGQLRLNAPVSFGTLQVAPLLPAFAERFPKVTVDLGLNDRIVDLVEEGWDLAIRIGLLTDSSLVSRRLAPCDTVVCASPAYLATHGRPRTLADLADHNCLGYTLSTRLGSKAWSFGVDGAIRIPVSGNLQANNGDALRAAAVAGMGLIYQPSFLVADDLQSGTLEALAFDHPTMPVGHTHAVFPPDRRMPLKVRAMIDFLADRLKPLP